MLPRLTSWERYCLAACYSDGATSRAVGEAAGVSAAAVRQTVRRAVERVVRAGLPRPLPWGVGTRAELRAMGLPEAAL